MKAKFKYRMGDMVGILKIDLDVPDKVREMAEMSGYSKDEINNLIGQEFQVIVELLALEEA